MLANRRKRAQKADADLDITSFMNLMIVLVPVLLMMMVFSRITVVELNLPGLAGLSEDESIEAQVLEVQVNNAGLEIYFPQGYLVTKIPMVSFVPEDNETTDLNVAQPRMVHDYAALQETLKQIKQTLLGKGVDKKDLSLLMQQDTDYQTIVSLIDASRSYKDVVAASVVDAELFPEVSLADAPLNSNVVNDQAAANASNGGAL
ncbi:ExbD/TolR family protein [Glaciecola sp. SC05]|uniref:ExbD/TolR family protein n=1 Tax=Glaciecola sp. SC05 TaxID=1987355 RepID=UPI003529207B